MAGPLDIQRVPAGLLDLLGLKAMGLGPVQLNESVSATLADCVDYYVAPRRVTVAGSTAVPMVANTTYAITSVAVPASELWLVYAFSVQLSVATAAATAINFWGALQRSSSSFPVPLTSTVTVGALDNGAAAAVFTRPLVWMPGDTPQIVSGAVTGVPNANGRVLIDCAKLTL